MQIPDEIGKKNPFKVPENYFEEVNRKILTATTDKIGETRKITLFDRYKPYLMIAASVAGFIIISYTALKLFIPEKPEQQVAGLNYEEYPEMYLDDIDILTLEESAALLDLFEELPEVNNADIIDYLLLEDIELNKIYEQL